MAWFKKNRVESDLGRKLAKQYRRYKHRWIWRTFWLGFTVMLLGGISIGGLIYHDYQSTPQLNTVFKYGTKTQMMRQYRLKYLNSEGKPFYEVAETTYIPTSLKTVKNSPNVVKALLAIEDRNFFQEDGVNWQRTVKAGFDTYVKHRVVGGSTITQQLIKLSFFSTKKSDQTIKRKVQEITLAQRLSKKYSKYQILTWYLNRVNYSNNQQGITSAAKFYYNKIPEKLTLFQAATLAGIVNSPAMYNPYYYPKLTMQRRNVVLQSLYETHQISKRELKSWSKRSIKYQLVPYKVHQAGFRKQQAKALRYTGFVSSATSQLQKYKMQLQHQNLSIKTTMNQKLQNEVDKIVSDADFASPKLEEGIVVFNNQNGDVEAMSGGRRQTAIGGYSRAYDLNRSSGSSIKPLLDYAPMFDLVGWNADTLVEDTPYTYPNSNTVVHDWDNGYQGMISIRQALVQSRNIPAVRALATMGLTKGQEVLQTLGLAHQNLWYPNAIGVDTSPLKMASAYSSLADNGYRVNQRFVTQVYNSDNRKLLKTKPVYEKVYSRQTAAKISEILQGIYTGNGTATRAHIAGSNQAGKTGTVGRGNMANALTDGWMIGYTKSHTIAIWVGYDNPYGPQILTDNTAYVAQDMYKQVMLKVRHLDDYNGHDWSAARTDSTTDNFTKVANRKTANLPFYLNMTPAEFLNKDASIEFLDQVYRKIE